MQPGSLADQIKKIRREKGLTQEKLAEMAGISLGHVIRLEGHRKINPTMSTLNKVCGALGVTLQSLMPYWGASMSLHVVLPEVSLHEEPLRNPELGS